MLAIVVAALCAAPAAAAPPRGEASFEWRLPSRYTGVTDDRGTVLATEPYQVRPGPWRVYLRVTGDACSPGEQRHRWSTGGGEELSPRRLGPCRYALRVSREGRYRVRLRARVRGKRLRPALRRIVVRDWLIVAIGDSVASGEGVPEAPSFFSDARWQSVRCHRSARAGVARAARQIEDDDGYSSVTFVHLACSGAEVHTGLLGPYDGAVPPRDEPPLEPQVDVLERIARERQVDAVLLSIGANDVNFSGIAAFCAAVASDDCFARPLPRRFGGNGVDSARDAVRDDLEALHDSYARLAARISATVPPSRVYISEYFDPTRDESGVTCEKLIGSIRANEVEQAASRVLEPLNRRVARAARENRWHFVGQIAASFRTHGYCADPGAWVTTLGDSLRNLGGIAGRHRGTLHPNRAGHEVIGALIGADLERDLYPRQSFPLKPFPQPDPGEGDGIAVATVVAIALAALLLWPAVIALTTMLLPLAPLAALLWFGRTSIAPLLLGLALGVLLVFVLRRDREGRESGAGSALRAAASPLVTLLKTARPLLLPLFVVIAIGAANESLALQVLLTAGLAVLAWRTIVAPEAEKSGASWRWERRLFRLVVLPGLVALGLGVVAIFVMRRLDFATNPYFATIGDLASGLVLVAILLWVAAIAMRLFSFATTPLRAVLAFDIGLALVVLAMAFGVVPGNNAVRDAWPPLASIFGAFALALLAADGLHSVRHRNTAPAGGADRAQGSEEWPLTRRAAAAGFSAAMVAALVLAVATAYGLLDADRKGEPLNPPEEEIASARPLPPAATSGEEGLELARRYAPALVMAAGERWAPMRVGPYLAAATITGPDRSGPAGEVASLPERCPEFGESRCYKVSIECDRKGGELCEGRLREEGRLYRDGAVYVRVLEKGGKPAAAEPPKAFVDRGPYRDRLAILIQYWYFYPYNEWRAPVFAGLLVQRHEADWEAVTIGLDRRRRPLFIADSAHCAGSWRPWREVEATTRLPGPRTHPLVAVAEGSHANYPSADEKRAPDWASCAGTLPAGTSTAISYASNIRDRTEYGWLWYPPPRGWIQVDAASPPMSFPGLWGADGDIKLRNFRANLLSGNEKAPATPSLQPLWRKPVETIFCDTYTPRDCERDEE